MAPPFFVFTFAGLILISLIFLFHLTRRKVRALAEALHAELTFTALQPVLRGISGGKRYEVDFGNRYDDYSVRIAMLHPFRFEAQVRKKGALGKLDQYINSPSLPRAEASDCLGETFYVRISEKNVAESFLRSMAVQAAISELFSLGFFSLEIYATKIRVSYRDPAFGFGDIYSPERLTAALRFLEVIVSN